MTEVLHLEFNPTSIAWIGNLQARTRNSSCPEIRERYKSWAAVGLGELALAIATRLVIARRVEVRLHESLTLLKDEVGKSGDIDALLVGGYCYSPSDGDLLFEICAALDSCFFEWRSLYEVVGKFANTYSREMLGTAVTESQLVKVVEDAGVPMGWINPLRENRKLFFHQTAPWIALEVTARKPLECNLVVMKENLSTLDDPATFVSEVELVEVSNGLRRAVVAVREWLKVQLAKLEAGMLGGAG